MSGGLCTSCDFDDTYEDPDYPLITIERLEEKVHQLRLERDKLRQQVKEAEDKISSIPPNRLNGIKALQQKEQIIQQQTRILNQLTKDSKDFLEQLLVYHNKHGCNGKLSCFCKNVRSLKPSGVPVLQEAAPGYRIDS